MANGFRPLLMFPRPAAAERNRLNGGPTAIHLPPIGRQRARIAPQLAALQEAFNAKRVRLQQGAPLENPEMVLVLEVVGTVQNFARAVNNVRGLDWLYEFVQEQIDQDEDFYFEEERDGTLSGRLYLLGTNQDALDQLLALWDRYQRDPNAPFDRGLAPIKQMFGHLKKIRPWNANDRVDANIRSYWQDEAESGLATIRFEIEAWHFASADKNESTRVEVEAITQRMQGRVLARALIPEIAYHGFLLEIPREGILAILAGDVPELLLSDRIMFFRAKAQSICDGSDVVAGTPATVESPVPTKPPIVALLDGVPLANHALLANRLILDDPDGWEGTSEVKDRVHGTAMASLIVNGENLEAVTPLEQLLYVRPIMQPDPRDFGERRRERTPDNVLLIDLIHRAVKRICEGDSAQGAVAPTVRVINLSMGDDNCIFASAMSPWARLLDWLAHHYSLLFIVSAGNDPSPLTLATPKYSLGTLTVDARRRLALEALVSQSAGRRLMAPAESINALTIGALHTDESRPNAVPNRYDLFALGDISPLSRAGHGYRRAPKPDVLMPGGRTLHMEQFVGPANVCVVETVRTSSPPGHAVAVPPLRGGATNETTHCRGTSNAAALASRAASQAYSVIENLHARFGNDAPGPEYDAVVLKALLVHGAAWGDHASQLLALRPDLEAIPDANRRRIAQQDFLTRWLGYGPTDVQRATTCTDQRATMLGFGEVNVDRALEFSAPLPPSLAGVRVWRRMTITLAWNAPVHPGHQSYRRVRLWLGRTGTELRLHRRNSINDKAALRGTVQHEILEGDDAVAFVDGDRFVCKVNCAADAGGHSESVRFALCVSLEVSEETRISIYDEVRQRLELPVQVNAA